MAISIHALLAESDRSVSNTVTPPSPFLSTLSLRRATAYRVQLGSIVSISIHALLAESDLIQNYETCVWAGISIHALLAESDASRLSRPSRPPAFLSTLSLRRATTFQVPTWFGMPNFYPRSPCGERRANFCLLVY